MKGIPGMRIFLAVLVAGLAGFPGAAFCGQATFVQNGQAMTPFSLIHVVGRNQDGRSFIDQVKQAFPERAAVFGVDGAGRFIEKQ